MSMDMSMVMYPGTPTTPHYPNLSQYPYDNLRMPPTIDHNYVSVSPHYEVFPSNLPSNPPRAVNFGVRTVFIYPFIHFGLTAVGTHAGGSSYRQTAAIQ